MKITPIVLSLGAQNVSQESFNATYGVPNISSYDRAGIEKKALPSVQLVSL